MIDPTLGEAAKQISGLRALIVITMPDCLLYGHWSAREHTFSVEDASGYFGDLIRANRRGLSAIGAWSQDMQVTIESADALVVLREIDEHFVCCTMFDREAPLGLVRLHLKQLIERLRTTLPQVQPEERPRGVRIIEFLDRYAPDSHAVLMRVATRTGIPVDSLRRAETLDAGQVAAMEEAAKRILGLDHLQI
ncbi:MAG: hypothetical protein R3B13_28220 [Polyangiaceae bacterium]